MYDSKTSFFNTRVLIGLRSGLTLLALGLPETLRPPLTKDYVTQNSYNKIIYLYRHSGLEEKLPWAYSGYFRPVEQDSSPVIWLSRLNLIGYRSSVDSFKWKTN